MSSAKYYVDTGAEIINLEGIAVIGWGRAEQKGGRAYLDITYRDGQHFHIEHRSTHAAHKAFQKIEEKLKYLQQLEFDEEV